MSESVEKCVAYMYAIEQKDAIYLTSRLSKRAIQIQKR